MAGCALAGLVRCIGVGQLTAGVWPAAPASWPASCWALRRGDHPGAINARVTSSRGKFTAQGAAIMRTRADLAR